MCVRIQLERILVLFCLHQDRYKILNRYVSGLQLKGILNVSCARWIWKRCSPLALQWTLWYGCLDLSQWGTVCMSSATILKLEMLEDAGMELSEYAVEAAAVACDTIRFEKIASLEWGNSTSAHDATCLGEAPSKASQTEPAQLVARPKPKPRHKPKPKPKPRHTLAFRKHSKEFPNGPDQTFQSLKRICWISCTTGRAHAGTCVVYRFT